MGQGLSNALGTNDTYQASNPLDTKALTESMLNSQNRFEGLQGQQQSLAQALLKQSQGAGPNPAQNMLNQATDQNIRQNAGMIASQKGINPLLARQMAAQNAGMMNQHAAGQAATMNAQQRLASQQQLGNLYGNMAGQNLQNVNSSGNLVDQSTLGTEGINAGVAAQNAQTGAQEFGSLMGAAGSLGAAAFSGGGSSAAASTAGASGGNFGGAMSPTNNYLGNYTFKAKGGFIPGHAKTKGNSPKNDTVPAMLSPGEIVLPRSVTQSQDADQKAKEFVKAIMQKKKPKHFGHVLEARRKLKEAHDLLAKAGGK